MVLPAATSPGALATRAAAAVAAVFATTAAFVLVSQASNSALCPPAGVAMSAAPQDPGPFVEPEGLGDVVIAPRIVSARQMRELRSAYAAAVSANDREALLSYTDADIYREAGQGGFEIRTFIAAAAAARGAKGQVDFCEPVPIFAVSCTLGSFRLPAA